MYCGKGLIQALKGLLVHYTRHFEHKTMSIKGEQNPSFLQFSTLLSGYILINFFYFAMGMCMLSKPSESPSGEPIEELTASVRSQIKGELEHQVSGVTFNNTTARFEQTASFEMGLASRDLEKDEDSLDKEEKMELRLTLNEDQKDSGFFQVKNNSTPLTTSKEDSEVESNCNVGEHRPDEVSGVNQFSFRMNSLKPVYGEEDYELLNRVTDQRCRQLILDTLKSEQPVRLESITLSGGETYAGDWKAAKRHGNGRFCGPRGVYEGQWANNKMNGRGVFSSANKERYEGEFLDGVMHGTGKLEERSGSIYEGEFRAGRKEGTGIEVYDHGEYYEGEWKEGYKHGEGHLQFSDGSYCRGRFVENYIHGFAEYYWAGQKKYRGEWALNKLEGKGVMEWEDGRRYEGSYANDKMEGRGTFCYCNGERFTGLWRNNKKNGKGEYTTEAGKVIKGVWYEDRLIEEYVNISSTKRFAITSLALTEPKD